MKRILYILICTAVWLMCIPGANAQVNDDGLTRSGEVSAYDGTRADFLTVAGKLSRYPKLSKAGESLKYAPIVTTDSVPAVYITAESARVYGNILFNGWFENVTAKGFELSTNADFPETATVQYPVVSETNQYVECDQPCTQNVFDLVIDQLQSSTTYYVRAFATNAKGTSYGEALTFTTLTAMNVAALPYFTDFSEEGDNENWFLNNGNCTNYWMMGTDLLNQNPALFITTNGETPGYNDLKPVTVMAERLLLMDASDSLTINLDVRMYGESSYDYLKVFLAPKSMLFSAADTNVTPYSGHSYSQYALRFPSGDYSYVTDNDGSRYLHLSCLIDNPLSAGDTAKLVFLWCNDRSTLREPPAIISSVEVIPLRIKTDSVSDIAYNAAAVYSTMTTTLTENLQRGLCYSKYPGVTLGGENCINVVLDQLNGSYSYNLTDLVPNTKYYVRAYALSGNGVISYGDELSFQTEHSTFVVTLPYKTNFSDGYDWLVEHTISTTQNYWNFGLLTDYTDSAMYVTYNDGTQAQYYTSATTNISAGRLLRMPQTDSVHVTFYVNCGGEGSYDWMKVLLVPVNEDITTDHYAFDYNTNAMDFSNYLSQTGNQNGPYKLNLTDGTLRIAANLKNPTLQDGDTAKLVFLWHTDGGSGTQPGPIITDLYVSVLDVDVYTDNVSDITDNSAKVNGYVHNPNNEIISKVGVCYGKHINPTFEDNFVESTSINADNTFILPISNLDYNTTYYVRTFMKVGDEVFFGDQIKFMTGMAVIPDELPYVTDFSDRQQWWMNSGDCQNYWKTGKLTDDGDSMLFITNDSLYLDTCGYFTSQYTFVTAEKYLKMPDNQNPIELTFDVSVGGESSYDYLMVYLCPMDQSFTPNSTTSVVPVTTNAFDFRHYKNVASGSTDLSRYYFNLTDGNVVHINDLMNNPTPGDTAKLVFLWRTDASAGTQPGPVISNLSVAEYVTDNVLPYSTNFSSDNEEWILYSGASKNYFMTGVPAGTTQSALFVTHDGDTCSYLPDVTSFTTAETYFSFPENDSLLLEFDAKAGGEGCCDYLMAFVSQWDVEYNAENVVNATSDNMGAVPFIGYSSDMSSTNTYRIQLTNGSDLHHFSVKVKNPARNGLGKLVFAWRNDGSGGSAPFDVMVTNVSLTIPATPFICGTNKMVVPGGQEYETVEIGGLCWTKSNLREVVGTDHSSDNATSNSAPYYYVRPNVDESIYGYYYNWEAAKIACPDGWHLPSDAEWNVMESTLTSQNLYARDYRGDHAGKLAYGTEWNSSDNTACPGNQAYVDRNASGFSARAAAWFNYSFNNTYNGQPGYEAYFWTSSKAPSVDYGTDDLPVYRHLNTSQIGVQRKTHLASTGMSVRCIRDMKAVASDCPTFEGNTTQNGWAFSAPVTVPSNVTIVGQYYRAFSYQSNKLVEVEAEYANGEIIATVDLSAYPNKSFQVTPFVIASGCDAQLSVIEGSSVNVNVPSVECPEFGAVRLSVDTFIVTFTNPSNVQIQFGQFRIPTDGQNESVLNGVVDVANGVMYYKLTSEEMAQYVGQTINVYPFMKLMSSDCGAYDITGLENEISFTLVPTDCPAKVQDASGHEYAVLQIGSQCWMSENLRTTSYSSNLTGAPTLSLDDGNGDFHFSNTEAYYYYPGYSSSDSVDQYGLLYNWYAVMAGQTDGTASQQVQGICPEGWHVPSVAEFETLVQSPYFPYFIQYPTCAGYIDEHNNSIYVSGMGDNGYFWSSDLNNSQTTVFRIYCNDLNNSLIAFDQSDAASVRCVKDAGEAPASFKCGIDKLTVPEGHEYETVELGGMCWTKTNLREPAGTNKTSDMTMSSSEPYYYVRPDANDSIYGYCYNWEAAKIACPAGWHLPSDAEWNVMESNWTAMDVYTTGERGDHAGKLAYGDEWAYSSRSGAPGDKLYNDRNLSQFSARAIGRVYGYNSGTFENSNYDAWFWTSSTRMSNLNYWLTQPIYHRLVSSYVGVQRGTIMQNIGLSVRCVKDMEVTSTTCATLGTTSQNGDEFSTSVSVPQGATVVGQYYTVYAAGVSLDNNYYSPELSETGAQLNNGNVVATLDLLDFAGRTVDVTAHAIVAGCDTQMTVIDGTPLSVIVPLPDICPEFVAGSANAMMNDDGTLSLSVSVNPNDYVNSIFWNNVDVDFIVSYSNGEGTYEESFEGNFYFNNPYNDPNDNEIIFYASNHFEGFVVSNVEARMSYANCEEQSITFPSVLMCPSFGPEGSHSVLTDLATGDYQIRIPVLNSENYDESDYFCYLDFPDQSSNGFLQDGYAYFPIPSEYNEDTMDVTLTIMGPNCSSSYSIEDFNVHTTPAADQCPYTFILVDNYGDGWNGGFLEVVQNEVVVDTLIALDHQIQSTQTKDTVTLELIDGVNISLVWNKGYYDHEVGIDLFGPDDNLLYTVNGLSDTANNTAIFSFTANCETSPVISTCPATVEDVDGNVYSTVQIGDQCWMKQNLRTTHFADSTAITFGTPSSSHYVEEPPYYYNNTDSEMDLNERGYLYNWFAVMNGADASSSNPSGVQGICPNGWHVPSNAEWEQFYNQGGLNSGSGFSPVYAGYVVSTTFDSEGWGAYFWTTTSAGVGEWNIPLAVGRHIDSYDGSLLLSDSMSFDAGYSVRCVKNADDGDNTESCPSLGVSQEAHSITAQYVYSPVIDFDADKIYNDYCGYGVFAGGSNVLIVRGKDYPNLVNTSFIEDNGSYNLWVTIDFDLIATAAQSKNVQVSSGDPITIMPILNLNGCPETESYGSTVILTMP